MAWKKNLYAPSILFIILVSLFMLYNSYNYNTTAIYYSPHPDDEILSMGPGIVQALQQYNEVIVVLLSSGTASKSYNTINSRLSELALSDLSLVEFGKARVQEFKSSVQALGVKKENIYVYDLQDGNIQMEDIKSIIVSFEQKYPNSVHHCMTYHDPHPDHRASGEALKSLLDSRDIRHGLFFLPIQVNQVTGRYHYYVKAINNPRIINAAEIYKRWNPRGGNYAIGYHSVPDYFEKFENSFSSRVHF